MPAGRGRNEIPNPRSNTARRRPELVLSRPPRLDQAVARQDRSGERGAIAYFDVDGFKDINDRAGHVIGDTVLAEIA